MRSAVLCAALTHWHTTVASLVTVLAGYAVMFPDDLVGHPMVLHICKFVTLGGAAAVGILAKDATAKKSEFCGNGK